MRSVSRMRGAVCQEELDRIVEPQPLRNPHFQLAFSLQLLIDQEIIPVGVVLDRSHAMRRRIVQCQQDGPPSQVRRGGGNVLLNKIQSPALAHNPGQIAVGVVVELAARRVWGLVGHPGQGERR